MDYDVRETMRQIINERGLIQAVVAKKAKLSPMQLSGVLNKSRKLGADELFRLCEALGVDADEVRRRATILTAS